MVLWCYSICNAYRESSIRRPKCGCPLPEGIKEGMEYDQNIYIWLISFHATISQRCDVYSSQILKGNAHIPKWLSQGAQDILRKILDPNPVTRIDVDGIRAHDWFKQGYAPAMPFSDDEEDISMDEDSLNITEVTYVIKTYSFHITPWF
jgi:serine/threonine protein kinase